MLSANTRKRTTAPRKTCNNITLKSLTFSRTHYAKRIGSTCNARQNSLTRLIADLFTCRHKEVRKMHQIRNAQRP